MSHNTRAHVRSFLLAGLSSLLVAVAGLGQANAGVENLGEQRTAVILVRFQNMLEPTQPPEIFDEALFTAPNSTSAFVQESSYGKAWLNGDIFGWYEVGADFECVPYTASKELVLEAIALADPEIYYPDYQRIIVITTQMAGPTYCLGSTGTVGLTGIATDDGPVSASWSLVLWEGSINFSNPLASYSIAHELTHNFGVWHECSYDCGEVTLDPDYADCTYKDYGSPFSVLGFYQYAYHPNGISKDIFGWLGPDQVNHFSTDGLYQVQPLETAAPGYKTIKIELDTPLTVRYASSLTKTLYSLYLDYRRPIGFDQRLADLSTFDDGLLLYGTLDVSNNPSVLLDATPESHPAEFGSTSDFHDAFLKIGKTFYETVNGIAITPRQLTADGALDVSVVRYREDLNSIYGRVSGVSGGAVTVRLYMNRCGAIELVDTTTTDPNGAYIFSTLLPTSYQIVAEAGGCSFAEESHTVAIPQAACRQFDFTATCE
ncbi:hypothetical protein ACFL43_03425 [Thermodesulfobacteriota bacterium]